MANTTTCRDCGGMVSTQAKACPRCGAPIKKKRSFLVGCLAVLLVGVIGLAVLGIIGAALVGRGQIGNRAGEPATQQTTRPATQGQTTRPASPAPVASAPARPAPAPVASVPPAPAVPKPQPMDIKVTSMIVKKTGNFTYRYFFLVKNEDKRPFAGEVTVWVLERRRGDVVESETFATTRTWETGDGSTGYMDVLRGPPNVHPDNGVTGYRFEAKMNGQVVATGTGTISNKYEDLSE